MDDAEVEESANMIDDRIKCQDLDKWICELKLSR